MSSDQISHSDATPAGESDRAVLAQRQLAALAQLSAAGMELSEKLVACARGDLSEREERLFVTNKGIIAEFSKLTRALCRIMTLEQETAGLRPMPVPRAPSNRDCLRPLRSFPSRPAPWPTPLRNEREYDDLHHYDPATFNGIVADLCGTLGVSRRDVENSVDPDQDEAETVFGVPPNAFVRRPAGRTTAASRHNHDPPS